MHDTLRPEVSFIAGANHRLIRLCKCCINKGAKQPRPLSSMHTLPTAVEGPLSKVSMTTSAFSASAPSPLFFFFRFFTPPSWPLSLSLPPVKDMGSPLQPWVCGYVVVGEDQHHDQQARPALRSGSCLLMAETEKLHFDGVPKDRPPLWAL